jgi:hypothetical protein
MRDIKYCVEEAVLGGWKNAVTDHWGNKVVFATIEEAAAVLKQVMAIQGGPRDEYRVSECR